MRYPTSFLAAAALISFTSAQSLPDITKTEGCVDASGFSACIATSVSGEQDCLKKAATSTDKDSCNCVGSVQRINCFAQSCWNKIYGCEYQTAVYSFLSCPVAKEPVPFWPSPDGAPGGCSCNTGRLAKTILTASEESVDCTQKLYSGVFGSISDKTSACVCCTASSALSAYANICPDTDPALIGLNTYTDQLVKGLPNGFNSCATTLKTYDCVRDFQYDAPSSGKLYGPADLPAKGTKSLSNTPGEVTAPVSGATFSWTAAGSVWTVTAASANGKAATTTGSKTTTAGTSSGTSSVAPTTTPNYGSQTSFQSTLAFAAAIVAMLACY